MWCKIKDCTSLRNELDEQHKIRMESFEIKMKPIIIRDGPSKKVIHFLKWFNLMTLQFHLKANGKIQAAKLAYEIYSLSQRLRYTTFRSENEEKVMFRYFSNFQSTRIKWNFIFFKRREQVEREVRILREKISVLKIQISTITKGVPMSKIEVREDKRSIGRASSPDDKFRSISLPTSGSRKSFWMINKIPSCL